MASPIPSLVNEGGASYVRAAAEPRPSPQPQIAGKTAAPAETVQMHAAYARLAAIKEDATALATSVRESARALQQARELVGAMRERSLAIIKNYPPFPPGSDERRQYLEGIQTLRRQMEALIYPPSSPHAGNALPVEYALPALDPVRATDAEVASFDQALTALSGTLEQGLAAMQELVSSLPDWFPDAPPPPPSSAAASDLSMAAAAQLSPSGPSLTRQGLDWIAY